MKLYFNISALAILLLGCSAKPSRDSVGSTSRSSNHIVEAYKLGFQRGSLLATAEVLQQFKGMYVTTNGLIELPNLNAYRIVHMPEILWEEETNILIRLTDPP